MKINHALILSSDLKAMKHFWVDIIGLEVGERPPFPFKGLWLYSDGTPFVHLAEQRNLSLGHSSIAHIAFEGADYKALLSRLKQFEYTYTMKDVPLSGDRQIFIQGPDGVTVEMLFPLNEMAQIAKTSRKDKKVTTNKEHAYEAGEDFHYLGGNL